MKVKRENLLEELGSIKHCIEMSHSVIEHEKTRKHIIEVLENRILQLEKEVDATISAQDWGKSEHLMDIA